MEPTTQVDPIFLLVGALALLALGILAGWKASGRWRWFGVAACLASMIVLLIVGGRIWQGIREDAQRSREIFTAIGTGPDLTVDEQKTFQVLSRSSARVREGVMRLAFANPTNAALALPRMEILLQSALQLDAAGRGREHLWNAVVQPALRRQPSPEVVLLAATTASIGGYGSNEVAVVLQFLGPLIAAAKTDPEMRAIELGVFTPLADFAPTEQIETAANLLLVELLAEPNPMLVNDRIGWHDPVGSRRVRDLRRLASRLSGASARRFADQPIPALERQTNSSRALALAKVLVELKAELGANQIDRALTNLARQSLAQQSGVMPERAVPIISLVEVMSPEQAARTMELLLEVWRSAPWGSSHREMTESLKPLVQRLKDDDVARLAEPMAAVFPDLVPGFRDRIPEEQAYAWADRQLQRVIDTPNETRRGAEVARFGPLAARLNAEQAGKLAEELWGILLGDGDDSRRSDEADCLGSLAPQLSDEKAAWLAEQVVEKMSAPGPLGKSAAAKILTPVLGRCDKATLAKAVAIVMKPYDQPQVWSFLSEVEPAAFLRGVHLAPAQMQLVLEPLVVALEKYDDADIYMSPATCLSRLADQMSPEQNERVANRLVFLYTQRPKLFGLLALNGLAADVTLTPYQVKRIVDVLLPSALQCRLPESDTFAQSAGPFLRRLDPEAAEATGQLIISTMGRMREQMCAVLDAKCLLPLTNVLRPDQARRLGEQLLQIPVQRGNHPGFASLMDSPQSWPNASQVSVLSSNYPGFARMLESHLVHEAFSDWALPSAFVERHEKKRYQYRLEAWSRSLAGMVERMSKEDARVIADQVAARCAAQGELEPVLFEENLAKVLQHASEPALNRILQTPFAVGGLRRIALGAWELKSGKSFHGDKWKFTASMVVTNTY